ncbi:MAG TPA: hypothetical protein VGJ97_00395 [Anaerolineaceae bacterium]|jgi:hypothetical protein
MSVSESIENSQETCACGGSCGCGNGHQSEMISREEYVVRLEQYLVDLKAEIQAVEAELADMRQPA